MTRKILLIEPFYAGSHKVLMDLLEEHLRSQGNVEVQLMTLTGKKWHWRARTSALYFAQNIPKEEFSTMFVSCVLPLHELTGLRPDLQNTKKIIYFHENQLIYPVRKSKERDFQYGYNQIMSCLAADVVLFNSTFNKESFLTNLKPFFKLQPDFRPKELREQIEPKCLVIYFPMKMNNIGDSYSSIHEMGVNQGSGSIRIVWPHRWEFDKNPDLFFRVLFRLSEENVPFRLSILGESFTDNLPIFSEAKIKLESHIDHFGFLPSKDDYYSVLKNSDIIVSTADHEFFGVAMLEGVYHGCFPLCPNKLVYPEIFPSMCLFSTEKDLFSRLKSFIQYPETLKKSRNAFFENFDTSKYDWKNVCPEFMSTILQ